MFDSKDFEPFHDWILVKPSKKAEYKIGNLIIPNVGQGSHGEGEVMKVGPLTKIEQGWTIAFNKGGGVEMMEDGEELRLLRDLPDLTYGRIK